MIWLRYELWEHHDGLSYRLADKAETDRLAVAHPEGVIKHIFYAPNTAAAVAQFYALRHLGPYVPGPDVSQSAFTAEQLASQQADFPEDKVLAGQGVAHAVPEPEAHPTDVSHDSHDDAHGDAHKEMHEPPSQEGSHAEGHAVPDHHAEPDAHPTASEDSHTAEHAVAVAHAEPETVAETAAHEPVSIPPPHDPKDLWPIAEEEVVAPRWASRPRRKSNPFLAFLRTLLLLIILAGIALGLCIVTGTVDGPALLTQVRDLSIVKSVLPSA